MPCVNCIHGGTIGKRVGTQRPEEFGFGPGCPHKYSNHVTQNRKNISIENIW